MKPKKIVNDEIDFDLSTTIPYPYSIVSNTNNETHQLTKGTINTIDGPPQLNEAANINNSVTTSQSEDISEIIESLLHLSKGDKVFAILLVWLACM